MDMPPVDRSSTSTSVGSPLNLGREKDMREVQFVRSQNYCVCFVRMVDSRGTTVNDSPSIRKYYSIFINTLSTIARGFGAKILKNITDGLIMYFPKTSNSIDDSAF